MNITLTYPVDTRIALMSPEKAEIVLKAFNFGIVPLICVIGIVANVFSLIVLKKQGLKKTSNILLFTLAFTDLCYLIGFNNFAKIIYLRHGKGRFLFSRSVSHFLFAMHHVFYLIDQIMANMSVTIPMLITLERFIAVYFPLRFPSIVTPTRVWTMLALCALYFVPFWVYSLYWYDFVYGFDARLNRTVGRIRVNDLSDAGRQYLDEFFLSIKVQPIFTLVGCILIIIRVRISAIKRLRMTTSGDSKGKAPSSKTTRTLLAVCLMYVVVCGIISLPTYLIYYFTRLTNNMFYQISNAILCGNSSWNFFIYVGLNNNFRDTFRSIIANCPCGLSSKPKARIAK